MDSRTMWRKSENTLPGNKQDIYIDPDKEFYERRTIDLKMCFGCSKEPSH